MAKICLDSKTSYGLLFFALGVILLLLAYFKNFLSVMVVLAAVAAIIYGALTLGLVQKVVGFVKGFMHRK